MTVTPWKLRSMGLNENRLNAGQLREGARVSIRNFDTVTEYTKAPDYLQVPLHIIALQQYCQIYLIMFHRFTGERVDRADGRARHWN